MKKLVALSIGLLAFCSTPAIQAQVATGGLTQAPAVDPAATKILKRMTDYVGGLKQFSVNTQGTLEDLDDSGHRIDYDVSAHAIVSRPNMLFAERRGDLLDQNFRYDGKTVTLCNPVDKVYATEPAPASIEGTLNFVRDSLGLIIPISDLVYSNSFPLLMRTVNAAAVVGKTVISGVKCDHLVFTCPGVDFQVWVADSGPPLPFKYVVTDTSTCARQSISTVMSNWNVAPGIPDSRFTFVPPKGFKQIAFMPINTTSSANR